MGKKIIIMRENKILAEEHTIASIHARIHGAAVTAYNFWMKLFRASPPTALPPSFPPFRRVKFSCT